MGTISNWGKIKEFFRQLFCRHILRACVFENEWGSLLANIYCLKCSLHKYTLVVNKVEE